MFKISVFGLSSVFYTSCTKKEPYPFIGKTHKFKNLLNLMTLTKYPRVAKQYFLSKGMDVEIIKIDGSVELAPILGLCDGIVDIMETGTTLKENGLVVLDTVCDISTRVIVNKASFKLKHEEVMKVINDLSKRVNEDVD